MSIACETKEKTNITIEKIKATNQDFEFYPTTDEIIFKLSRDIKQLDESYCYNNFHANSILDIGAGNGKVLNSLKKAGLFKSFYAIEKANTLKKLINDNVYIIGTNFYEQSLLDKTMDVTFSNPPYSDFVKWSCKIIRESCSRFIYLVIPTRWKDSPLIIDAIKYRDANYKTLGEYNFLNAERPARATVNLLRIKLSDKKDDSFDRFFAEEFKNLKDTFDEGIEINSEEKENKFKELVIGDNYVKTLVQMYNVDINNIKKNYKAVQKLDSCLLKEFEISPEKILSYLKDRLKTLKNLYWDELIKRMKQITERLTKKNRNLFLETIRENSRVDFTESNIYAVILWILNNAGKYIDDQVISVYEEMLSRANCINYKSNEKVFVYDRWRYDEAKETPHHIKLDYRIIMSFWGALDSGYSGKNEYRLSDRASDYISDLLCIANNLGFETNTQDCRLARWDYRNWIPGKHQNFEYIKNNQAYTLFDVKAHKNGNLHFRFNQKFMLALNVEFGRLKGWIHSKGEAVEELQEKKAFQYFKTNFSLLVNPVLTIENKTVKNEMVENLPLFC